MTREVAWGKSLFRASTTSTSLFNVEKKGSELIFETTLGNMSPLLKNEFCCLLV